MRFRSMIDRRLLWSVGLPLAVYAAMFFALRPEAVSRFRTHLFADDGDGLQCYWNLWWVDQALTRLHRSPWFTDRLHYPHGTTLIGHTLHPLNGLLAIGLQRIVPLAQAYNVLVIQSFLLGGLATFWLARAWDAAWVGALFAGAAFAFSEAHFAHAAGHLQLTSIEWLPLFLLAWTLLLSRPTPARGAIAGIALLLVILIDYYYFAYAVVAGTMLLAAHLVAQRRDLRAAFRRLAVPLGVFTAVAGATAGAIVVALIRSNASDALGGHPTNELGFDLAALLVPGWSWRFGSWTEGVWGHASHCYETALHPSLAVSALAAYAWWRRRDVAGRGVAVWTAVMVLGLVASVGPVVRFAGWPVPWVVGPYGVLEWLVPAVRLSGVPARAILLVALAAAMVAAFGLPLLWQTRPLAAATLVALFLLETAPGPMIATPLAAPPWVGVLANQPDGGVVDRITPAPWTLFFQTIHHKPLSEGYLARIPRSVILRDGVIVDAYDRGDFGMLCHRFGIRYAVLPAARATGDAQVLWQDGDEKLVALSPRGDCVPTASAKRRHNERVEP
jgi:hypothetical protein